MHECYVNKCPGTIVLRNNNNNNTENTTTKNMRRRVIISEKSNLILTVRHSMVDRYTLLELVQQSNRL